MRKEQGRRSARAVLRSPAAPAPALAMAMARSQRFRSWWSCAAARETVERRGTRGPVLASIVVVAVVVASTVVVAGMVVVVVVVAVACACACACAVALVAAFVVAVADAVADAVAVMVVVGAERPWASTAYVYVRHGHPSAQKRPSAPHRHRQTGAKQGEKRR